MMRSQTTTLMNGLLHSLAEQADAASFFYALKQEAPNKNLKKGHGWKAH